MNHDHSPTTVNLTPAFRWAVILNAGYVVIELAAGFVTGSLALLADGVHNLTDVVALLIAWGATKLAALPPSGRFTYGYGRGTVMAALANAVAILIGVGIVISEAFQRLSQPTSVPAVTVLIVAMMGIVINAGTALLFRTSRHGDLNAAGAYLHMAADAAVSLGVVLSAVAIMLTGWMWLDAAVAILVSAVIAWSAFGLLRTSLGLSFDAVPAAIDHKAVSAWLNALPGVQASHDLHIWSISTARTALTVHLVMPNGHPGDAFIAHVAEEMDHEFSISHVTIQIETGNADQCMLEPDHII